MLGVKSILNKCLYVLIHALIFVLSYLPLRAAYCLCLFLSWLWWYVIPIRKKLAVSQFNDVFKKLPAKPYLRRMMTHLCMGYCELFYQLRKDVVRIDFEHEPSLLARTEQGLPSLILMGHLSAWDLVGPLGIFRLKVSCSVIVKQPSQPVIRALMEKIRRHFSLNLLPTSGSMPMVRQALQKGQWVTFILDQRHAKGLPVPFFGKPAWTSVALAHLAHQTQIPVYFSSFERVGLAHYRVRFIGPIKVTGDVAKDTAHFMSYYEQAILACPENWFWLHDRFKKPKEQA